MTTKEGIFASDHHWRTSGSIMSIQSANQCGSSQVNQGRRRQKQIWWWWKVMLCIWWDMKEVVYYELLKQGETITGEVYRQQLMGLKQALAAKRPEWDNRHDKIILQHDNARPHVAISVKNYLDRQSWETLPHPLYSPDMAPSDYHLFRSMQSALAQQHFTPYENIKKWVDDWIASKLPDFFLDGIRSLPERWTKVLASDRAYFE